MGVVLLDYFLTGFFILAPGINELAESKNKGEK